MSLVIHQPNGQELKVSGQALTLSKESSCWIEAFLQTARQYLASLPDGALFAIEDVRGYCDSVGLNPPHTHKVWGALPRVMLKEGLPMVPTDRTRRARSPNTRAHRINLWAKTGGAQ